MSNTYTRFGFHLPMRSLEEAKWCKQLYDALNRVCDSVKWEGIAKLAKKYPEAKALASYVYDEACLHLDLSIIAGDRKNKLPLRVSISSEWQETGDPEAAAQFVRAFLQKFRPNHDFTFIWIGYSDRPGTDSLGGGAFYVTPEEIHEEDLTQATKMLRSSYNPGARLKPLVK